MSAIGLRDEWPCRTESCAPRFWLAAQMGSLPSTRIHVPTSLRSQGVQAALPFPRASAGHDCTSRTASRPLDPDEVALREIVSITMPVPIKTHAYAKNHRMMRHAFSERWIRHRADRRETGPIDQAKTA